MVDIKSVIAAYVGWLIICIVALGLIVSLLLLGNYIGKVIRYHRKQASK